MNFRYVINSVIVRICKHVQYIKYSMVYLWVYKLFYLLLWVSTQNLSLFGCQADITCILFVWKPKATPFLQDYNTTNGLTYFLKEHSFFHTKTSHSQNIHCYKSMCEIKYENKVYTKKRILIQDFFITLIVYNTEKHV